MLEKIVPYCKTILSKKELYIKVILVPSLVLVPYILSVAKMVNVTRKVQKLEILRSIALEELTANRESI